jgi:hypothetical protein
VRQLFVGTLSSAENLENQLEDSVNYLLAQSVFLKESENVADEFQKSLEELHKSLSALLELRENLDDLMNERGDEFHDLLPPFIFAEINKILAHFFFRGNSKIGKISIGRNNFFVTLLMNNNLCVEKLQGRSI